MPTVTLLNAKILLSQSNNILSSYSDNIILKVHIFGILLNVTGWPVL